MLCAQEGCSTIASYSRPGCLSVRVCAKHKAPGMLHVYSKYCEQQGCPSIASYNTPGCSAARFCAKHAPPGMEDVKKKRCEHAGCSTKPNYNEPGSRSGRFCAQHKLCGMENVRSKRCEHTGCNTTACYNTSGSRVRRFCAQHKLPGMELIGNKRCEHEGCKTQALYNTSGSRAGRFCAKHRLPGMEDVKNKTCKTAMCATLACSPHLHGYCLRCFIHQFPDNKVVRNYKTKERAVADFVRDTFPNKSWVFDKTVADGCSSHRPDIMLDMGAFVIFVEVDESQHQAYDCACENKRLMRLFLDAGSRPIALVRFNPDAYTDAAGKRVPSCWSRTPEKGLCVVPPKQQPAWRARLDTLRRALELTFQEGTCGKTVHDIRLYFDEAASESASVSHSVTSGAPFPF